jgi:Zn-finger nucleic acid-binding protein
MTDAAPFRERPKFLLCPRCGEMLEHAFDGVLMCLRCEGMWIAAVTVEKAFGDPRWPGGPSLWWRNELECPECAVEGAASAMNAASTGGVLFDRCPSHGLWLDRTELGRLMGIAGGPRVEGVSSELAALRDQLASAEGEHAQHARRREARRSELEQRRKEALELRARLDADRRRADEASAQAAAREREAASLDRSADREREARRELERMIQRLGDSRQEASEEVGRIETRIIMLREQLHAAEAELDGARARLRAVDDQLAAVRASSERV